MTHWRDRLREADSARWLDGEPDRMDRVRQVVIDAACHTAAEERRVAVRGWAFVIATAMVTVAGVAASWQASLDRDVAPRAIKATSRPALDVPTDVEQEAARQQLHFSTPGGTRIIWVFDSQFDAKGTLP
jgi:hypothetical protein